jgi:hypothetical protein
MTTMPRRHGYRVVVKKGKLILHQKGTVFLNENYKNRHTIVRMYICRFGRERKSENISYHFLP